MKSFLCATTVMALAVMLAGSPADAAEIHTKNFKFFGNPASGHVNVEFDLHFKADAPGDIVFILVAAGQDKAHVVGNRHTGNFNGRVKAKLATTKSVNALKGTMGNKPLPIVVHAAEVYNVHQAEVWMANHATFSKTVHTFLLK